MVVKTKTTAMDSTAMDSTVESLLLQKAQLKTGRFVTRACFFQRKRLEEVEFDIRNL